MIVNSQPDGTSEVSDSPTPSADRRSASVIRRLISWSWRIGKYCLLVFVCYLLCALIGLLPANRDFREIKDGVPLTVFAGPIHCDLIVPVEHPVVNWRDHFPPGDFAVRTEDYSHVAIGWGDRGFYLDTRTWNDLKASTLVKAIFVPSPTVLHVQYQNEPYLTANQRQVTISAEQYAKLVEFILAALKKRPAGGQDSSRVKIDFRYYETDAFYEANGSYHAFNTCNCWAADAVQSAGVCVPRFSPFPWSVQMYFPDGDEHADGMEEIEP